MKGCVMMDSEGNVTLNWGTEHHSLSPTEMFSRLEFVASPNHVIETDPDRLTRVEYCWNIRQPEGRS